MAEENIQEEVMLAEKAVEPGTYKGGEVVHEGDEEVPVEMTAIELESAGWVYLYDMETGERSLCNRNMLHQVLKFTRNGKRVFTTQKPNITPSRGTLKCLLHPDHPERPHFDELGLPTCKKANLRSPYQVELHMQKRHKAEWAAIQRERQDAKERDERERQDRRDAVMAAALSGRAPEPESESESVGSPEAPLYVSPNPKKKTKPKKK